jgi:hypothetical protein
MGLYVECACDIVALCITSYLQIDVVVVCICMLDFYKEEWSDLSSICDEKEERGISPSTVETSPCRILQI